MMGSTTRMLREPPPNVDTTQMSSLVMVLKGTLVTVPHWE